MSRSVQAVRMRFFRLCCLPTENFPYDVGQKRKGTGFPSILPSSRLGVKCSSEIRHLPRRFARHTARTTSLGEYPTTKNTVEPQQAAQGAAATGFKRGAPRLCSDKVTVLDYRLARRSFSRVWCCLPIMARRAWSSASPICCSLFKDADLSAAAVQHGELTHEQSSTAVLAQPLGSCCRC